MTQNLAALHGDPVTRPGPHRLALAARLGASEWVSRVSSLATNRPDSSLEKGAGNLASWPAASQISPFLQYVNGRGRSFAPLKLSDGSRITGWPSVGRPT